MASPAGYSGTPLPKKLGIKPGTTLGLDGAPPGFEKVLGPLPEGVKVVRNDKQARELTLWFVRTLADLTHGIRSRVPRAEGSGLWICWPKRTSKLVSDLRESHVRDTALDAGLVDFKVCAVDADWSGLRFALRDKSKASKPAAKASRTKTP